MTEMAGQASLVISGLLTIVISLVAYTFLSFKADAVKRIDDLIEQNREQALAIKTLEQQVQHADKADSRLSVVLEKLDDKIDRLSTEMGKFGGTLDALSRRLTGQGIPRQP